MRRAAIAQPRRIQTARVFTLLSPSHIRTLCMRASMHEKTAPPQLFTKKTKKKSEREQTRARTHTHSTWHKTFSFQRHTHTSARRRSIEHHDYLARVQCAGSRTTYLTSARGSALSEREREKGARIGLTTRQGSKCAFVNRGKFA